MHASLFANTLYLLMLLFLLLDTNCFTYCSNQTIMDINSLCRRFHKGRIYNICNRHLLLRKQIEIGVAVGHTECQHQFRHRKWNCTSSRKGFKRVLLRDTRETGFVNAILAAGIAYQVSKACTSGELGCPCNRRLKNKNGAKKAKANELPERDFQWEGCRGGNIEYGIKKSRDILDSQVKNKKSDMKTFVKLHNYVAGRLAIKNNIIRVCKCHGLSGSCTLRTCWKKLPSFREVGNRLKERFDGAAKVIADNEGRSFMPEGSTIKHPGKLDLVYSEETPDYCAFNSTIGSFGTHGRLCNETSIGEEGCGILCCSRGHKFETVREVVRCKCKFKWCCDVICEECVETKKLSICL